MKIRFFQAHKKNFKEETAWIAYIGNIYECSKGLAELWSFFWSSIPESKKCREFSLEKVTSEWAEEFGCNKDATIPVPGGITGSNAKWQRTDWWRYVLSLTCDFGVGIEKTNGPIHSYSYKLPKEIMIFHEKAFNRIFFSLSMVCPFQAKRWSHYIRKEAQAKVYLTHDVDYISKNESSSSEKTALNLFNLSQSIARERGLSSKVKDILISPTNKITGNLIK